MNSIGIRAEPSAVHYAIYDPDYPSDVSLGAVKIPKALRTPDALKFLRSNMIDIMREQAIERAGVRVTESISQNSSIIRMQIEGVILEAFASSPVIYYRDFHLSSFASILNKKPAEIRDFIKSSKEGPLNGWNAMNPNQREAALSAIGACRGLR